MPGPFELRIPAALLGAWGLYQVLAGLYFIILRPGFLPEDMRASGTSLEAIRSAAPGIEAWLRWVFAVLGGQMAAVGVLVIGGAVTIGQGRRPKQTDVCAYAVAGAFSVVVMSGVNFALVSDFRWLLVAPVILWVAAIFSIWRRASGSASEGRRE